MKNVSCLDAACIRKKVCGRTQSHKEFHDQSQSDKSHYKAYDTYPAGTGLGGGCQSLRYYSPDSCCHSRVQSKSLSLQVQYCTHLASREEPAPRIAAPGRSHAALSPAHRSPLNIPPF